MLSSLHTLALVVLLLSGVQAFVPVGVSSNTHVTITGNAVMKKIYDVCEAVAESEGREFKPTGSSVEELLRECLGTATGEVSGAKFHEALNQIYMQNGLVDRDFMTSSPHHFSDEAFNEGHALISQGTAAIKANIRKDSLQAARETLGRVLHTLQDFYSHSNWVELGNKRTYVNLIRPDLTIHNIADVNTSTCSDCATGTCSNPLLPSILNEKKLTSGYMGLASSYKPKGKCSHGGDADLSSTQNPRGGISKDERHPHNVDFHNTAVSLATEASLELLEDIRGASGNNAYLRLMGIARSAVLCFVIDTTGSMADDITEAKRVAYNIIDSKKGTQDEPSEYILVPFNDPKFGPLTKTTDPDVMKREISKLTATGGGDEPEMCLSGLQLALTGAPASSHIYVFTDAPAKDMNLEKTIIALIHSTKSTVSFFITSKTTSVRTVRMEGRTKFQLYYDFALASGGQAIEVSKANLPNATDIIVDSSTSALVTILQQAKNPGRVESFPFLIDASLSNVTAYITGNNLIFTLHSPSGVTQTHTVDKGPLALIQTVGNLRHILFSSHMETGLWHISMESTAAYTIKVTGQSPVTFIYSFVEEFKGPHPGFATIDGRPQTGLPTKLLLTVTGQKGVEALKIQEVALVEVSGARASNGTIEEVGGGDFLVTVSNVPEREFVVMVKGEEKTTASHFQRQSTTQMSLSTVTVKATVNSTMLPGKEFKLKFTITTNGTSGTYSVIATNDRNIPMRFDSTLNLVSGGSAEGTVIFNPPANIQSGTDVTLTIGVEGPGPTDTNFAVVPLSVLNKVTDFTPPKCVIVGVSTICPTDCTESNWDLSVNITDGNGSGIQEISIQKGNGNFSQDAVVDGGVIVVMGLYSASCCSPDVTVSAVDKEGNVGKCIFTVEKSGGARVSLSVPLGACLLALALSVLYDIFPLL
ncbi:von Willebrand factor A domain-containing protein 7 [Electrophorus electricus]|uniref:von Willebrand factor A domain-containing protein 7 n=1 Tax=Electrophorus electricus TaxID=8005 RepID=UPI0015D0CAA6|nr:von Willebrand factor A domain-containing protein 7 [Electrophorus electricus]